MSPSREIHVVPQRDGAWAVRPEVHGEQLSIHTEATDATRAALERADREGIPRVVVHDLYGRVRTARPAPRRRR